MDFLKVTWRTQKKSGPAEIYPVFIVKKSKDLMIRGGDFYAVWKVSSSFAMGQTGAWGQSG